MRREEVGVMNEVGRLEERGCSRYLNWRKGGYRGQVDWLVVGRHVGFTKTFVRSRVTSAKDS